MSGRIFRTMSEARALRDHCGREMLRFPRTEAEAGLQPGPYDSDADACSTQAGEMIAYAALVAAVVAVVVWAWA